jgi:peptidoglycan/xylan/chitin deacetylase (PgdA/CDA1 family)
MDMHIWLKKVLVLFAVFIFSVGIGLPGDMPAASAESAPVTYVAEDTAWDDYYIGGEGSVSTDSKTVGANSVKITTVQRSVYNGISKELLSAPLDLTGSEVRFFVMSPDWNKVSYANLVLSSDGYTMADTFTFDIKASLSSPQSGQWIEVVMPRSAFESYGSPDWANIDMTLLRIKDNGTDAGELYMDGFGYSAVSSSGGGETGKVLIADDTAWDDYRIGGEGSVSTDDKIVGESSVKVTTVQRSVYNGISKELFSAPLDLTGKGVSMYVKSSDWEKIDSATLILSSDGYTMENTYTFDIKSRLQNPQSGEWIEVVMPMSTFESYGSPDRSYVDFMLLQVRDNGTIADLSLDGLSSFGTSGFTGVVSITFDDGWADSYTKGKLLMDMYGHDATAFVIPELLGTKKYLTQAQVDALYSGGWDIAGHGDTDLRTLTAEELTTELSGVSGYLATKGYRGSDLYAYPYGALDNEAVGVLDDHFSASFNINGMNQPFGYASRYSLNRQSLDKWTTVAQVKEWIDSAKNEGDWCILNFHTLVNTPSNSYDYSISNFTKILNYLRSSGVEVKTVSDVMSSHFQGEAS